MPRGKSPEPLGLGHLSDADLDVCWWRWAKVAGWPGTFTFRFRAVKLARIEAEQNLRLQHEEETK